MNKIINTVLLTVCIILATGCSTWEKFTVYGTPDQKIYSPQKEHIATVNEAGKATIEPTSDAYYAYLLTHDDHNDLWVPFGLDVRKNRHGGTQFAAGLGITMAGIGIALDIAGTAAVIIDKDSPAVAPLMLGGLGVAGVGASFGVPASLRMEQLSYQYNFGYLKYQQSNADIRLTGYNPPVSKETPAETPSERTKATSATTASDKQSSTAKPRKSSASSKAKSRKSVAETIAGEYSGKGNLESSLGDKETLETILIKISPSGANEVAVEIFENGEAFFDAEEIFSTVKNKDGAVTLIHKTIPSVRFTIYKTGAFDYLHPRVNIDDLNYKLTIKGTKTTK